MGETRQQLKERLQAAGLWGEYVRQRGLLMDQGLTPALAREEALRRVESLPPRTAPTPEAGSPSPGEGPDQEAEGGFPDFGGQVSNPKAVQWVAEHIADPSVRPQDAPGGLAWGLLQWVRLTPANQTTFWSSIWPRLSTEEKDAGEEWDGRGPCPTCRTPAPPTKEEEAAFYARMEGLLAQEWAEYREALKIIQSRRELGLPPLAAEGVPGDEDDEGGPGRWR
jgi:hypothetical protein